ncbi:MAG: flagellin [Verrucomicrobiota bacterium]|jgi:flagellin
MVINTNVAALTSANNLDNSTNALNASLARLSSGSKIVNASDNPAGLAQSMELNMQIAETNAGNANVSDALSFSQTQDGYLQQVSSALNQMASLAIAAQDPTLSPDAVTAYQSQFAALQTYITGVSSQTFNGVALFGATSNLKVATGNGNDVTLTKVDPATDLATAIGATTKVDSATDAATASTTVATAITALAAERAAIGANEQALTFTGNTLSVLSTNLSAAKSTLSDVDVAQESTNYAKEQILVQSGTAMLAQANANPQSILKLLQ